MRKLLILLLLAAPAMAQDPAEGVRLAETGFAKAFADRDKEKFFSYVADDATFMSALGTLRGKARVIQGWSGLLASPQPPFYTSMWRRESDGSWQVIFDGPGAAAVYKPEDSLPAEEGFVTTEDGVKLHYRKSGASPVTVIIPLEFVMWDDFRQLSEIATVIAYDPRNRARSSRSADPPTIQQHARVLRDAVERPALHAGRQSSARETGRYVVVRAPERVSGHPHAPLRRHSRVDEQNSPDEGGRREGDGPGPDDPWIRGPERAIRGREGVGSVASGRAAADGQRRRAQRLDRRPLAVFTSIREFLRGNWPHGAEER